MQGGTAWTEEGLDLIVPSLSPHCPLEGTKRTEHRQVPLRPVFSLHQVSLTSVAHPAPLNQVVGMCKLISSWEWWPQQKDQQWHVCSWANLACRCFSQGATARHPSAAILCLFKHPQLRDRERKKKKRERERGEGERKRENFYPISPFTNPSCGVASSLTLRAL